jgi:ankyrin repeat protein
MFQAIKRGDFDEVKRLDPGLLISRPETDYVPLHWACGIKDDRIVDSNPNLEILAYIIENTDISVKDKYGNTVILYLMAQETNPAILDIFWKSNKPIDMSITKCSIYLNTSVSHIKRRYCSITPFHCACINGIVNNVKYIIDNRTHFENFDINYQGDNVDSSLSYVVKHGCLDLMYLLIEAGARLDFISHGQTLLHKAVYSTNLDIVAYFVKRHYDIHAEDENGNSPLSLSITDNTILSYLLDHDSRIPHTKILCTSVLLRELDIIKMLLNHGVDPNGCDEQGLPPLHHACRQFNSDIVLLLLDYGADPELKDQNGLTCVDLMLKGYHRDPKNESMIIEIIKNYEIPLIKEPEQ